MAFQRAPNDAARSRTSSRIRTLHERRRQCTIVVRRPRAIPGLPRLHELFRRVDLFDGSADVAAKQFVRAFRLELELKIRTDY